VAGVRDLVTQYYEPLYRYAYRLSGSQVDAEDLTQETFLKAQTQFAQLRDPTRAKPWLFAILRNAYLHRVRADKGKASLSLDTIGELPEKNESLIPEVGSEELQQALNNLEEGFRTPLILYFFEDFSYRDISEQMNLPIGTVMSRLNRAKEYLRRVLAPSEQHYE
jgi:RNA polymerase sigma-70 factor (ECF subfamily)